VIKSGGIKIVPEILEKKIAELTGREVLVLGVPDKKLGQKLVLVVEENKDLIAAHSDENPSAENHSRPTRPVIKYSGPTRPNDKQSADIHSDPTRKTRMQSADSLSGAARQKDHTSKGEQSGQESVQSVFSKASLSRVLQKHELPKEIITIPSFPRNKSMKIDRNAVVRIITRKE